MFSGTLLGVGFGIGPAMSLSLTSLGRWTYPGAVMNAVDSIQLRYLLRAVFVAVVACLMVPASSGMAVAQDSEIPQVSEAMPITEAEALAFFKEQERLLSEGGDMADFLDLLADDVLIIITGYEEGVTGEMHLEEYTENVIAGWEGRLFYRSEVTSVSVNSREAVVKTLDEERHRQSDGTVEEVKSRQTTTLVRSNGALKIKEILFEVLDHSIVQ